MTTRNGKTIVTIRNGYTYYERDSFYASKGCHTCKNFQGYGAHAVCGFCKALEKEITGGYLGNYEKIAHECELFDLIDSYADGLEK